MTVRKMTLCDLETVLGWATREGWNPGVEDAAAFFAADPDGFLVKEVDGALAAAVSVVNHDAAHAFLGLYICDPAFRGRGYGMEVWRAGRAHAGTRSLGLDGVPDQQENYIKDGFTRYGRTTRFEGMVDPVVSDRVAQATNADLSALAAMDARAVGYARPRFLKTWFAPAATRRTFVIRDAQGVAACATARHCETGIKVGPFHAEDPAQMQDLLCAAAGFGDGPVYIDVPQEARTLQTALAARSFKPVFETARMYSAAPPAALPPPYHAVATLELG